MSRDDDDLSLWLDDLLSDDAEVTTASSSWHQARWRETAPASRVEVLDLLQSAYPGGMTTLQLVDQGHPRAQARIHELGLDGWSITQGQGHDGTAMYTLVSLTQGKPPMDPDKAPRASAGRWYRLPDGTIHVESLCPRRGPDTDTWDQDQADRDVIEVRRALTGTVED